MLEKIVQRQKLIKTEIKSTDLKFFENGALSGESVLKQKIPSVNFKFGEGVFYARMSNVPIIFGFFAERQFTGAIRKTSCVNLLIDFGSGLSDANLNRGLGQVNFFVH